MAFKDHNFDACEAAYQLACDAEENRYKLTLPLTKSVLLCESLVVQEAAVSKKSGEGDVQVGEDAILTPACLSSGKWVISGDSVTYHQNIMQAGTMIHVFSTDDRDSKPMLPLARTRSTPLPGGQPVAGAPTALQLTRSGVLPTTAAQLLAREFYEQSFEALPQGLDPSGLFEFKQPDLQRDRDFFKQMLLSGGEDFDDFGDAPMDYFASDAKNGKALKLRKGQPGHKAAAAPDEAEEGEVTEGDMFEEVQLTGTHRLCLKN